MHTTRATTVLGGKWRQPCVVLFITPYMLCLESRHDPAEGQSRNTGSLCHSDVPILATLPLYELWCVSTSASLIQESCSGSFDRTAIPRILAVICRKWYQCVFSADLAQWIYPGKINEARTQPRCTVLYYHGLCCILISCHISCSLSSHYFNWDSVFRWD